MKSMQRLYTLALFGCKKFNAIFNKIKYLIRIKSSILYVVSHNYGKIKTELDDDLRIEEAFILHNIVLIIKFLIKITTSICIN